MPIVPICVPAKPRKPKNNLTFANEKRADLPFGVGHFGSVSTFERMTFFVPETNALSTELVAL